MRRYFGLVDHAVHGALLADLLDVAHRLFLDGGQTARDVALGRLRIGQIGRLVALDHGLVAVEHLHEVGSAPCRPCAALGDDFFAAGDLRRFAEHERGAERMQLVECVADGRVGAAARGGVGFAAFGRNPEVADRAFDTLCSSVACCTYSLAAFDAFMIVSWSPWPSMPKPTTGLPVFAIPSTTFLVQLSSMPITTTAATFGLQPAPISVAKCRSRSAPNWRRPYGMRESPSCP